MKIDLKKINFKKIVVLPMAVSYLIAASLATVAANLNDGDVYRINQVRAKLVELDASQYCTADNGVPGAFTTSSDEAAAITAIDNAIAGITCGSVASSCGDTNSDGQPDPEMTISVSGLTGPGDTVTWCGVTFTHTDLGPYTVCPDFYDQYYIVYGTSIEFHVAKHFWQNNDGLRLARSYGHFSYGPNTHYRLYSAGPFNFLSVNGNKDRLGFYAYGSLTSRPISFTYISAYTAYDLNKVLNVGTPLPPAYGTYALTSEFFGSWTDGASGITYTWNKGAGW
ncbi:hypothetical protein KY321_01285 [Candidatus Woesearchaeota archaeon]|nr:hypothetical protein [Candidatus Woesearchaeota archaeon]